MSGNPVVLCTMFYTLHKRQSFWKRKSGFYLFSVDLKETCLRYVSHDRLFSLIRWLTRNTYLTSQLSTLDEEVVQLSFIFQYVEVILSTEEIHKSGVSQTRSNAATLTDNYVHITSGSQQLLFPLSFGNSRCYTCVGVCVCIWRKK